MLQISRQPEKHPSLIFKRTASEAHAIMTLADRSVPIFEIPSFKTITSQCTHSISLAQHLSKPHLFELYLMEGEHAMSDVCHSF
jgi:hypothetical protein